MTVGELKKELEKYKDTDEVFLDTEEGMIPAQYCWGVDSLYISDYVEEEEEPDYDDSIDRAYDDWLDDRMEEMYGKK